MHNYYFQILHVGGQMDILRCWLTQLVPGKNEPREKRESVIIMTKKIVRKHQKIIMFSEHIEDLYTYIALVQFTTNTLLMCMLGFLTVTVSKVPNITYKKIYSCINENFTIYI